MTTLDKVGFNTQPPEGGWAVWLFLFFKTCRFNTQPPEGGWESTLKAAGLLMKFQHTAARRRLESTVRSAKTCTSFNTQPPEGGWECCLQVLPRFRRFQHTAARRRLDEDFQTDSNITPVSTHSRPKAAGDFVHLNIRLGVVSTHSRPKAAGQSLATLHLPHGCFNTQPPEGGWVSHSQDIHR